MQITEHVSYNEIKRSRTAKKHGIDNAPKPRHIKNITALMREVFEPIRERLGNMPIHIESCFRSIELNNELDGALNSQHLCENGAAMDLDNDGYEDRPSNYLIFLAILESKNFDQLIWEAGDDECPGWVHVSYVSKEKNRGEVLRYKPGVGYWAI